VDGEDVALRLEADLSPHVSPDLLMAFAVDPDGRALTLQRDPGHAAPVERIVSPGGASFPTTRADEPYACSVLVHEGAAVVERFSIPDAIASLPRIQLLSSDEIVLVSCRVYAGEGPNAWTYATGGIGTGSFLLGDGIQDVQADGDGRLWVSFFDEGVFGNFGWGPMPGEPAPMGATGLVCVDERGEVLYRYAPPESVGPIDDCYALNVTGSSTWAYYYSGFPLVEVDESAGVRAWKTPVSGARALAIDGDRVLLAGGYPPDRDRVVLGRLGEDRLEPEWEGRLVDADGTPFTGALRGRGTSLHALIGTRWMTVDVDDVLGTGARP
jgi:hypothetical protein